MVQNRFNGSETAATACDGSPRPRFAKSLSVKPCAGRTFGHHWKPIPFVGSGVIEIRVHAAGEYRVFYVAKFEDAVYVLHVFAKKTRKASSLDVELGNKRYRELLERRK